jgi:hypothetical protein
MFTPAEAIRKLDAALSKTGQDVSLVAIPAASEGVRAFVRGYRPDELAGSIRQGDREVVISPTGLVGTAFEDPEAIAKVEIAGRRTNVEGVEPVYLAGVLVRINLQVRG